MKNLLENPYVLGFSGFLFCRIFFIKNFFVCVKKSCGSAHNVSPSFERLLFSPHKKSPTSVFNAYIVL